jgi:hypothetical protein
MTAGGVAGLVAAAMLVLAPAARADGDPASDYLITQRAFLPFNAKVSAARAKELNALLVDAKKKGFPLKVAVIAERYDLGAVPSLFGKPQQYASFLGQEDYYFFKDLLLVVMPQGYGLYKHGGVSAADRAAVAALAKPGSAEGDTLVEGAERAVRALAARRGLTLAAGSSSSGSQTRDRLEIVAGVLVLAALAFLVRLVVRRR